MGVKRDDGIVPYAYDIWTRAIGPTTFQEEFLQPLNVGLFSSSDKDNKGLDTSGKPPTGLPICTAAIQSWLKESGRLIEVSSGRVILDCAFVRIDKDDCVVEILNLWRAL